MSRRNYRKPAARLNGKHAATWMSPGRTASGFEVGSRNQRPDFGVGVDPIRVEFSTNGRRWVHHYKDLKTASAAIYAAFVGPVSLSESGEFWGKLRRPPRASRWLYPVCSARVFDGARRATAAEMREAERLRRADRLRRWSQTKEALTRLDRDLSRMTATVAPALDLGDD